MSSSARKLEVPILSLNVNNKHYKKTLSLHVSFGFWHSIATLCGGKRFRMLPGQSALLVGV